MDDSTVPTGIMTMVGRELHGAYRAQVLAGQVQAAEQGLAPVLKVMRETGLIADGYKAALAEQMPVVGLDPDCVSTAVRGGLIAARDLIRDRVDLASVPDALVGFNHAVISLQGDDGVASVAGRVLEHAGMELC